MEIVKYENLSLGEVNKVSQMIQTFEDLHASNLPSLAKMSKQYGQNEIMALIALKIDLMLDFFNAKMSMNDNQKEITAKLVCKNYYFLTFSDIEMCFERAMSGNYGKLYASIDGSIILNWLKLYSIERGEAMELLSQNRHQEAKKKKPEWSPEVTLKIKELLKKLKDEKNTTTEPS